MEDLERLESGILKLIDHINSLKIKNKELEDLLSSTTEENKRLLSEKEGMRKKIEIIISNIESAGI